MVFYALQKNSDGLREHSLMSLEKELRRVRRKKAARAHASIILESKSRNRAAAKIARTSFKQFLRKKYGNTVKAWLHAIDLDGSMSVP